MARVQIARYGESIASLRTPSVRRLVKEKGPLGVEAVLTAINQFTPDEANLYTFAKLGGDQLATRRAIWVQNVLLDIPINTVITTAWWEHKMATLGLMGRLLVSDFRVVALDASALGAGLTVDLYRNGIAVAGASVTVTVVDSEQRSNVNSEPFDPEDVMSFRTITGGAQTFAPVQITVSGTVASQRRP